MYKKKSDKNNKNSKIINNSNNSNFNNHSNFNNQSNFNNLIKTKIVFFHLNNKNLVVQAEILVVQVEVLDKIKEI